MKFVDVLKYFTNNGKIPHPNIFLFNDDLSDDEIKQREILFRKKKIEKIMNKKGK